MFAAILIKRRFNHIHLGSSSGIGEEAAVHLASLGARVVVTGRNAEGVKKVAEKCRQASNEKVIEVVADLLKDDDAKRLIDTTIDAFGTIDVLVNNAGIGSTTFIDDSKLMNVYEATMNTNVRSVLLLTSLAVPYLVKSKGSIINISSDAAVKPVRIFHYNYFYQHFMQKKVKFINFMFMRASLN